MNNFCHPLVRRSSILTISALLALVFGGGSGRAAESSTPVTTSPDHPERLVSMVLLLKQPRTLDEHTLGNIVSQAVGIEHSHDTNAKSFVVAKPPYYRVQLKTGSYVVNATDGRYFSDAGPSAASIADPTVARALRDHRAWLSVDWLSDGTTRDLKTIYCDIARITAALAGPDTLAIYCPDMDEIVGWDSDAEQTLRSADPLRAFAASSDRASTVSIDSRDPKLLVAEERAKETWSDFVRAFREKKGSAFALKGRITEGRNAEYLWLNVTAIDATKAHGKLDNEPTVAASRLKLGQDLHIDIKDVDDWLYLDEGGRWVGGYTVKVLETTAQQARRR